MVDRVGHLRGVLDDNFDKWKVAVTNPYVIAYSNAYQGYTDTMKAQAEADKARAELFVTVASVVTGSILMATFAETSYRVIASNAALSFVCNRNLERTFNAMAVAAGSKTFMFALGKTLDQVDDAVGKAVKDSVTKLLQTSDVKKSDPASKSAELDSALRLHRIAAMETAKHVEASTTMSEAKKNAAFAHLLAAPICRPPGTANDAGKLAEKIELSIYLKMILDSDELVDWPAYYGGPSRQPTGSHPIPQLPSAPDYPHPAVPTSGAGQTIGYSRPGGSVRDRVDILHKAVFNEPFYAGENALVRLLGGSANGQSMAAELRKAERQIDNVAQLVRPMSLLEVKS